MPNSSATVPLAPIEVPSDPICDRLQRQSRGMELVFAGIVVVFAFLLASVAVRNSDFWLHLATGRLIANSAYQFGVDPFASTTGGIRWVNHSWLFDWLLYQFYQVLAAKVVVMKALLVALVAVVMMAIGRRGGNLGLAAIFTALTLLVASPRLLLQPMLISLLFVSLTIWLLARGNRRGEWLLPPLFALWVNLDAWFILGPITVAIFAVASEWKPGRRFVELMRILIVGIAACSLNPHHIYAFQFPPELSPVVRDSPLLADVRFQRLFESPWHFARYADTAAGLNPAGLAYFMLLALGVVSFLYSRPARGDWRLPLWVLFAALGAYQLRLVPFFAVVTGPITALNYGDILAARPTPKSMTRLEFDLRRGLVARFFGMLAMVAFAAVAWPGWLQATPHDLHRCEWSVREDPTLSQTAMLLADWYEHGDLPADTRIFVNHPEAGPYLAWHCPRAKTTIDPRLALFAETNQANEFVAICRALNPELKRDRSDSAKDEAGPDGRILLRQRKIALLFLYDPDALRSSGVFTGPIVHDPERWPQFVVSGKAVLVAHRDLVDSGFSLKRLGQDMTTQAFAPQAAKLEGDGAFPTELTVKDRYIGRRVQSTSEGDAATMYLRYFDEAAQRRQSEGGPVAAAAAQVPLAAAGHELVGGVLDVSLHMAEFGAFIPFFDPGPVEAVFLAVRAARRAVAADPNDALAWLRLGHAYISLRLRTREGAWNRDLPVLDTVRHVQVATALENAVRLNPRLILAHRLLANLYMEREFFDLAFDHRRQEIELMREAGPGPGEKHDTFATNLESAEKRLRDMEKQVQERLNKFVIEGGNLGSKPLDQAQIALKLGLARKALDDVMLKSDVRLFGVNGAQLQLNLLLMTGRAERARHILADPDVQDQRERMDFVGAPSRFGPNYPSEYRMLAYDWFSALVGAASGNYDQADRSLIAIDQRTQVDADEEADKIRNRLATLVAAEVGAFTRPEIFIYQMRLRENRISYELLLRSMELSKLLRADIRAIAGLLSLERGDIPAAREHFHESLALARDSTGRPGAYAGRPAAEVMLKRIGN